MPTARTTPKLEAETPVVPIASVPEPPAPNVVEALARVMRDLPAIGKDNRADPKQGGYAYRGIEQITRAVQPLLAKHGVIFVPRVTEWRPTREILVNQKPWTDESMLVTYRVYGPGGSDDYIEITTPAIGRDNSDKGANKCMTQAFKYALLQVLCIADAKDDGDQASYEADGYVAPEPIDYASRDDLRALRDALVAELAETDGDYSDEWKAGPLPAKVETLDAMLNGERAFPPADAVAGALALLGRPSQPELVPGALPCPSCGTEITGENPIRTWPDPASEEEPAPMVAGCASCEPM